MWFIWEWIGLGLMLTVYALLVYWQRKRWLSPCTEIGIVAITMMFFDWLMTWFGQFPLYWHGVIGGVLPVISHPPFFVPYYTINETNPIGWFLLSKHPMAFALGFIFYMIGFVFLIRFLNRWSGFLVLAIGNTLAIAHGYYAIGWFFDHYFSMIVKWLGGDIKDLPEIVGYIIFIIIGLLSALLLIKNKKNIPKKGVNNDNNHLAPLFFLNF